MEEELKVSISIPFPSKQSAQISFDVLRVDEEPKRNHIEKKFYLEENILRM